MLGAFGRVGVAEGDLLETIRRGPQRLGRVLAGLRPRQPEAVAEFGHRLVEVGHADAGVEQVVEVEHGSFGVLLCVSSAVGSSRSSTIVRQKAAAGAPSKARWSQVRLNVSRFVASARPLAVELQVVTQAADAEDGGVGRVDHGGEPVDAEPAERAHRERAAFQVGEIERTRARRRGEACRLGAERSRSRPTVSWITGTISPLSSATAMPTCAVGSRATPSAVIWELTSGWSTSAAGGGGDHVVGVARRRYRRPYAVRGR